LKVLGCGGDGSDSEQTLLLRRDIVSRQIQESW